MNTRKILFIIIAALTVALILFLFLIFTFRAPTNQPSPQPDISPTATGESTAPNTQGFQIISSTPQNQAINVSVNTPISILFNKDLPQPSVTVLPSAQLTSSVSGRTLTITPSTSLSLATKYTITLTVGGQSFFLIFTTVGPTPTLGPNTRSPDQSNQDNQQLKSAYPDTYLSNYTPYSNTQISVTSAYISGNPGHFQFTVTSKNSSVDAKTVFQNWAVGQGLSTSQIASLDVVYE